MTPLTAGRVARRLLAFYQGDASKWNQGWFRNPDRTCFCVLGALQEILHIEESPENAPRYSEAAGVLGEQLGEHPFVWNDACPDFTTFQDGLKKIARLP